MELYVTVSFWVGVVGLSLRLLIMMVADYPRSVEYSAAADAAITLISAGFVLWAGTVLFGA